LPAASQALAFDMVEPGEDLDRRDHINYHVCRLSRSPILKMLKNF
jgi:hypothetical protein